MLYFFLVSFFFILFETHREKHTAPMHWSSSRCLSQPLAGPAAGSQELNHVLPNAEQEPISSTIVTVCHNTCINKIIRVLQLSISLICLRAEKWQGGERALFLLLVHSPNAHSIHAWTGWSQNAWMRAGFPTQVAGMQVLGPTPATSQDAD